MLDRNQERRRVLKVLGATGLATLAPAVARAKDAEAWRIGAALDVTGGASFLGVPEHNAIVLAVEQVNAAGGIKGRKVDLAFEDSKSTETDSVLAVRKLISQDKVSAIIGPSRTGGVMAVLPIATEAEVPLLAPVSGVNVVEPVAQRKWIFRPGQGGDLSGKCSTTPGGLAGRSSGSCTRPTPTVRMAGTICASSRPISA
jgi:branched-chain amino acid transport system substrate-binding protein